MTTGAKYWQLVRIDSGGRLRVEKIEEAKIFFEKEFPELNTSGPPRDLEIQSKLISLAKNDQSKDRVIAQICLRCWISSEIQQVCLYLEHRFGSKHGFTRCDLFPLVLDDTLETTNYTPLSLKILQTFEQNQASLGLATWINRKIQQTQAITAFLLEKGVYLASDWAILNDTKNTQLQLILEEFHRLAPQEIEQALLLLEAYHNVYLQERLIARKKGTAWKCVPPTIEQLQRIAQLLPKQQSGSINSKLILAQLQKLAQWLRQYRIYVRGGAAGSSESLENISTKLQVEEQQLKESETEDEQEQKDFLKGYREEFLKCLDVAIEKTIQARLSLLLPPKTEQFLKALELLHCQRKSMGEIAPKIGLNAQYQVTRLLKLEDFRADVQHTLLNALSNCILDTALSFLEADQLLQREQQIIAAMNEDITELIKEAADQVSTRRECRIQHSVFAQHLCQYLQQLIKE